MRTALLLSLIVLAPLAAALPEAVQLGQYDVSFDLAEAEYAIETEDVMPEEGTDQAWNVSHLCWLRGEGVMLIALTEYEDLAEVDVPLMRKGVIDYLNGARCKDIQTHEINIDRRRGVLGLGETPSGDVLFCAIYWPDLQEVEGKLYGQTDCTIASRGAPLEVTENLLNSIHVETARVVEGE